MSGSGIDVRGLLDDLGYEHELEQAKGNWGISFEPKGAGVPIMRVNGLVYSYVDRGVLVFKKSDVGYTAININQIVDYRFLNDYSLEISLRNEDVYYISLRG